MFFLNSSALSSRWKSLIECFFKTPRLCHQAAGELIDTMENHHQPSSSKNVFKLLKKNSSSYSKNKSKQIYILRKKWGLQWAKDIFELLKASNSKRRHRKAGSSNRADWRGSEKAGRALDGDLDEHGGDLDYDQVGLKGQARKMMAIMRFTKTPV